MSGVSWTSSSNGGISIAASRPEDNHARQIVVLAVPANLVVDIPDHRLRCWTGMLSD